MTTLSFKKFVENAGGTPDQVRTVDKTDPTEFEPKKKNYIQRVLGEYKSAGEDISNQFQNSKGREPLAALHTVGDIASAAFAPITEAISPIVNKGIDKISDIPAVQNFATKGAGKDILDIRDSFVKNHPEMARSVEDVNNIVNLLVGAKVGKSTGDTTASLTEKLPTPSGALKSTAGNIAKDIVPTMDNIVHHQVTRALDLTQGDIKNIESATGNRVPRFLADNNLIEPTKQKTVEAIDNFYNKNYEDVRTAIKKVDTKYHANQIPGYTDSLKSIKKLVDETPGLEKSAAEVDNLLEKAKNNNHDISLDDVQRVKELLDEHFNLYKVTGDVKEGAAKQGLANFRSDLKNFIEDQVKEHTGEDISKMNNNVATARSISDAVNERSTRGLTRSNLKMGDLATFGTGSYFGGPLMGGAAVLIKKIFEAPSVQLKIAKWLDGLSDAQKASVKESLKSGDVPPELESIVSQAEVPKDSLLEAARRNLKNPSNAQGGFIDFGGIIKRLDTSDRDAITSFVDDVYAGRKPKPEIAQKVQNFADSENLENAFRGDKPLADELVSILDADREAQKQRLKGKGTVPQTVLPNITGKIISERFGDVLRVKGELPKGKSTGFGDEKILNKRNFSEKEIKDLIEKLPIKSESENRIILENKNYRVILGKDWEGTPSGLWLENIVIKT